MARKMPLTYEEFKEIYSRVPRLCVDVVIKNKDGILLTLRKKHGWIGQWHTPGVTVYMQEKIEDAVQRAALDEIGVPVKIIKFAGYQEYFSELKERGFGYTVAMIFLCEIKDTKLTLDDQVEKAQFFKEIPENTVPEQRAYLPGFLKKNIKMLQ